MSSRWRASTTSNSIAQAEGWACELSGDFQGPETSVPAATVLPYFWLISHSHAPCDDIKQKLQNLTIRAFVNFKFSITEQNLASSYSILPWTCVILLSRRSELAMLPTFYSHVYSSCYPADCQRIWKSGLRLTLV